MSDGLRQLNRRIKLSEHMLLSLGKATHAAILGRLAINAGKDVSLELEREYKEARQFILRALPILSSDLSKSSRISYPIATRGAYAEDYQPILAVLGKYTSVTDMIYQNPDDIAFRDVLSDLSMGDGQVNLLIGYLQNLKTTLTTKVPLVHERDAEIISALKDKLRRIDPKFEEMYDGAYDALRSKNKESLRHAIVSMRELLKLVIDRMGVGEKRKQKVMSILGTERAAELVDSLVGVVEHVLNLQSKEMKELQPDYDDTVFAIKTGEYTLHYILTRRPKDQRASQSLAR
jgi:hypothetical protein